jgi:hypothetical protein
VGVAQLCLLHQHLQLILFRVLYDGRVLHVERYQHRGNDSPTGLVLCLSGSTPGSILPIGMALMGRKTTPTELSRGVPKFPGSATDMEQSGAKAVARRWHENGLQLAVVKTDGDVNMTQVLKEVLEDELGYTKFVYGESLSDSLKYYYQIKDWNHGSKSVRDLAMSVKNCEVTDRLHAAPVACGGCAKWVDPKTGKCTGMWTSCKGITKEWERKHARRATTTHFRTCEAKAVENNFIQRVLVGLLLG